VMWAVKLGDAFLPALGVLPVMALASRWAKPGRVNAGLALVAALLVPASSIALMMVGDFEKIRWAWRSCAPWPGRSMSG